MNKNCFYRPRIIEIDCHIPLLPYQNILKPLNPPSNSCLKSPMRQERKQCIDEQAPINEYLHERFSFNYNFVFFLGYREIMDQISSKTFIYKNCPLMVFICMKVSMKLKWLALNLCCWCILTNDIYGSDCYLSRFHVFPAHYCGHMMACCMELWETQHGNQLGLCYSCE